MGVTGVTRHGAQIVRSSVDLHQTKPNRRRCHELNCGSSTRRNRDFDFTSRGFANWTVVLDGAHIVCGSHDRVRRSRLLVRLPTTVRDVFCRSV